MFINCPHCHALVATDPATDLPPERCPRCAEFLHERKPQPSPAAVTSLADAHATSAVDADLSADDAPRPAEQAPPPSSIADVLPVDMLEPAPPSSTPTAITRRAIGPIATMLKRFGGNWPTGRIAGPAAGPPAEPTDEPTDEPVDEKTAELSASIAPASGAADLESGDLTVVSGDTAGAPPDPGAHIAIDAIEPVTAKPAAAIEPLATPDVDAASDADASPRPPAPETSHKRNDEAPSIVVTDIDAESDPEPAADSAALPQPATATKLPSDTQPHSQPAVTVEKPGPSFAHRRPAARVVGRKTIAAVIALGLLLALQLLLADRARLAADAHWRPLLTNLCGALGCTLPAWHDPSAFTILARDVRPHPGIAGALHVTASFRNDAHWAQDWPRLRLVLSDVDGNAVAGRDLNAAQYLGAPPTQSQLGSGQSASVAFDVLEPGQRSVAFDFTLH